MMDRDRVSFSREELMKTINEVSFAVNDLTLFLDTHPNDQQALACFREQSETRNRALKAYAAQYGPLTIDTAADDSDHRWDWVLQPWPWEGGC